MSNHPTSISPSTTRVFSTALVVLDLFCSGHSLLPDGRLLITGGTCYQGPPHAGVYDTTIVDYTDNCPDEIAAPH